MSVPQILVVKTVPKIHLVMGTVVHVLQERNWMSIKEHVLVSKG